MERLGETSIEIIIDEIQEVSEEPLDIIFQLLQAGSYSEDEIVAALVAREVVGDEEAAGELLSLAKELLSLEDDVNDVAFSLDAAELADKTSRRVVTSVYIDDEGNTAISFGVQPEDEFIE